VDEGWPQAPLRNSAIARAKTRPLKLPMASSLLKHREGANSPKSVVNLPLLGRLAGAVFFAWRNGELHNAN
jgi:hypothetical protein